MEGTNTGPLEGPMGTIQPTHKHVVGKGVQVFKVEKGKITEARIYFDLFDQMTQLGMIPTPAKGLTTNIQRTTLLRRGVGSSFAYLSAVTVISSW